MGLLKKLWAQAGSGGDQFPINYVPPVDEGRPRH
jgi:hypothetical protein